MPVHQAEVGRQPAGQPLRELLVGQFLDVRGVLARLGAQLEQHLAARVQPGVLDEPAQQVGAVGARGRYGGLGGEHHGVASLFGPVRGSAQEGQGGLGDGRGVGADALVHRAETLRVVRRVGEDDVRAVAQEQPVGQLLVDDADVSGDDDGAAREIQCGQAVQHGLDAAADEGEDDDVVRLVAHGVQELDGGDLADPPGVDADLADLRELAGRRGGPAAQQQPADLDGALAPLTGPGGQAARGERAPFPPGVGVGEDGDPERRSGRVGDIGRIGLMAGT